MNQAQKIMSGFEISNLDSTNIQAATHKVAVIEDADGEAISGFIIVGKNSPEYQAASNAVRHENIKRAGKRSKQVDTSTDEGAAALAKTVTSNERTIALAITVGWFGFNLEGSPMTFDKTMVEKLFDKFPQWQVRVNAALENDANFMKV